MSSWSVRVQLPLTNRLSLIRTIFLQDLQKLKITTIKVDGVMAYYSVYSWCRYCSQDGYNCKVSSSWNGRKISRGRLYKQAGWSLSGFWPWDYWVSKRCCLWNYENRTDFMNYNQYQLRLLIFHFLSFFQNIKRFSIGSCKDILTF